MVCKTSSEEYASAEEMLIDEGGIDLFIDGIPELSASFEGLDPFELAYRVLPEDFDVEEALEGWSHQSEQAAASTSTRSQLEAIIWIFSQELAERRGYAK